jgi:hypothetical protein
MKDRIAPDGMIWVCTACGKTAKDRYQSEKFYSWDESCVMNAILVEEDKCVFTKSGFVKEILE